MGKPEQLDNPKAYTATFIFINPNPNFNHNPIPISISSLNEEKMWRLSQRL